MATTKMEASPRPWADKFYESLHKPVDGASVAVMRILLGILVPLELIHYYFFDPFLKEFYVNPTYHFKYPLFGWVPDLPGSWVPLFLVLLGGAYILFALGWQYRFVKWVSFLGFTFLFLTERASFLNHWYMVCLMSFLFLFIPANGIWSLDAKKGPEIRKDWIPAWGLYALIGLISVVYFYAGLVKINPDWLVGQPMIIYLQRPAESAPEWLAAIMKDHSTGLFMAYAGMILELIMVPLLLWRPTRWPVFIITILFHFSNDYLFTVGLFPYLMLACTLLYFPPDWPRKLLGKVLKSAHWLKAKPKPKVLIGPFQTRGSLILWGLFWGFQLLFPLRSLLYEGNQLWTEEGLICSWKMMLEAKTGAPDEEIIYWVYNVEDESYTKCDPKEYGLTWAQKNKLIRNPDLIHQFSLHVAHELRKKGIFNSRVFVDAFMGLNGRPMQRFIHPNVNLFNQPRQYLSPYPWVMPLLDSRTQATSLNQNR